ncbi:MAG: 4-hydroxy-tetrahydrodipicolinate synthase [Clostridia bacterium]|nr:4-hydroxy-tetrahydrodipicolinate synthase [Clostridia bacterium]
MKESLFRGVATALITPTNESGVDYAHLGKLIDYQIEAGIPALVVCATTGEAPTLSDKEHLDVLKFAVDRANGRTKIIAGTGSNDTQHAIQMTKDACSLGVDGILTVTPYYNKATQSGLVASFGAIADASSKPMIVYSVPSRTGVNIEPKTCAKLAEHPNIVAIKEASGNLSQILEIAALTEGKLDIYSGNDDQIVPILSVGGIGVISVLSNVVPKQTIEICDRWFAGDIAGSLALQKKYLPLIKALFSQVNPIPAKAALARMGYCEDYIRLPLVPMEEPYRSNLYACMDALGI